MRVVKLISLQSLQNIFLSIVVRKRNLIVFEPPFALSSPRPGVPHLCSRDFVLIRMCVHASEWVRVCERVRLREYI